MGDLELIKFAITGNKESRQLINKIVDPFITCQSTIFCKRFCHDKSFHYQCSLLKNAWYAPSHDIAFCEWGNASYAWMLEYLTNDNRLRKFAGKNGATLKDYGSVCVSGSYYSCSG